jgi:chromosome segregation ATPase
MRSYRSFNAVARARLVQAIGLCIVLSALAFAGQEAKKRIPKLTTEDVMRGKQTVQVVEDAEAEGTKAEGKTDDAGKGGGKSETATSKADPEQHSWRERVEKARERAKAAQRESEEVELETTDLRNKLGTSGSTPRDRNETAAELNEMGPRLKQLRDEARAADADLKVLLEYGKEKGFAEAARPKATGEDGQPNEDYYKSRLSQLNEALQDADRRIQLYENRIRDLNGRMNNPNADRFSNAQLQQDRDDAQASLQEAHDAKAKARSDLEDLMDEARRAGVAPSLFR